MDDNPNRFEALFKSVGATEKPPPKKKGGFDFGATMKATGNQALEQTFHAVRELPDLKIVSLVPDSSRPVEPLCDESLLPGTAPGSVPVSPTRDTGTDRMPPKGDTGTDRMPPKGDIGADREPPNRDMGANPGCVPGTDGQPQGHTLYQSTPRTIFNLARNQAALIKFLINKTGAMPTGYTNYREIEAITKVTKNPARKAVERLRKLGFIQHQEPYQDANYQGISFVLNRPLCEMLISEGERTEERLNNEGHAQGQPLGHRDRPRVPVASPFSSSSDKNLTTTFSPPPEIDLDHPDLVYWKGQGITAAKVKRWLEEVQGKFPDVTEKNLVRSLKYAAFDIPRQTKPVQKPDSWFYQRITTYGAYDKPAEYVPYEERIHAQRMAEEAAEEERQQARLREMKERRERRARMELEILLEEILADRKGEAFLELKKEVDPGGLISSSARLDSMVGKAFFRQHGLEPE